MPRNGQEIPWGTIPTATGGLQGFYSRASLARLDAATEFLPNPELFVAMYVRKEAVLSSQIEGTQASLNDLLDHEGGAPIETKDVNEVVNYVKAMNLGLERLKSLPLSLRLIKEIHAALLENVRGGENYPGDPEPARRAPKTHH